MSQTTDGARSISCQILIWDRLEQRFPKGGAFGNIYDITEDLEVLVEHEMEDVALRVHAADEWDVSVDMEDEGLRKWLMDLARKGLGAKGERDGVIWHFTTARQL